MLNKNIEYEKFAQSIYQTLLNNDEIKTVIVQHNVKIKGQSGCKHQIDVYWEFEIANVNYKVAIECKNYKSEVSIGKVRDFCAVLEDIGNIKGIMVTKKGYQSGALQFAESKQIDLKVLRKPIDEDWEGRVKTIVLNFSAFSTDIVSLSIEFDSDWLISNKYVEKGKKINLTISGMTNEILITDSSGQKITSLYDIYNSLPHEWKEVSNLIFEKEFNDAFIETHEIGKTKFKKIIIRYNVNKTDHQTIVDGEETAKAILKDVKSGKIKFFDNKGNMK